MDSVRPEDVESFSKSGADRTRCLWGEPCDIYVRRISLENSAVFGAIEDGRPIFELETRSGLFRVKLGMSQFVRTDHRASCRRNGPVQLSRSSTFRRTAAIRLPHITVWAFPEATADEAKLNTRRGGFDGRAPKRRSAPDEKERRVLRFRIRPLDRLSVKASDF